jgi:hypothetical protein
MQRYYSKGLLQVVYVVIIVALIGAIVSSFHGTGDHHPANKPGQPSTQRAPESPNPPGGQSYNTGGGQPAGDESLKVQSRPAQGHIQASGPSTSAAHATPPAATNSQLTNTGPGDTLAIFLAVTAFGTLLHKRFAAATE